MRNLVLVLGLVMAPAWLAQGGDAPVVRPAARISGGVMAGHIQSRVSPQYPADARAAGVSGTVILHALISKEGTVERLTVISGPELLRDSAVGAVRQWTYQPYLLNGVAVEVDTTITVNYYDCDAKPQ